MLNLKWMGKDRAVKYKPVDRTIMIRITDKLKEFEPLQSDDFIDVLELKFNDINILHMPGTAADSNLNVGNTESQDQ